MIDDIGVLVRLLLLSLLVVVISVGLPQSSAATVQLSGSVHYSGSQGPVSATRPVFIFLFDGEFLDEDVDLAVVATNGGPFVLVAPAAGTYYLGYILDVDGDGDASVGEPGEIYDNRLSLPADPIILPQSGVTLDFDDRWALPGMSGTVTYTGNLGPVSPQRELYVEGFLDPDLTEMIEDEDIETNGGRYDIITFDVAYLRAYLDVNGNDAFDAGEPFEIYSDKSAPPGDPVVAVPPQTDINFTFGDENAWPTATPTWLLPTHTRTPAPTPTLGPCYGDCNGDGAVAVNELITGVNIALGNSSVESCPVLDWDGNGEVAIHEIIKAVSAALNGCA